MLSLFVARDILTYFSIFWRSEFAATFCQYDDAFVVYTNKISTNIRFDAFESLVNIDNM